MIAPRQARCIVDKEGLAVVYGEGSPAVIIPSSSMHLARKIRLKYCWVEYQCVSPSRKRTRRLGTEQLCEDYGVLPMRVSKDVG